MGLADSGQACVIRGGAVVLREDSQGTDAMLKKITLPQQIGAPVADPLDWLGEMPVDLAKEVKVWFAKRTQRSDDAPGGILFKAPKPDQDRRADLPLIGPRTAMLAAEAGLDGIVIEAGGVMVLDLSAVRRILDAQGMFLWVRGRGAL